MLPHGGALHRFLEQFVSTAYDPGMRPSMLAPELRWPTGVHGRSMRHGAIVLGGLVLSLASGCNSGDVTATGHGGYTDPDSGRDGSPGDASPDGSAGAKGDSGTVEAGPCVPKTCAQLGATCGTAPDGCGGKVTCGTCATGQKCGGGGTNKCGTSECSPKSCSQVGASCGYASDGCSQALDCGGCVAPATCGGGGKQNQCGCAPRSCAQLGASCGSVPDGCGGKLDCGTCNTGETCGGNGVANQCGTGTCSAKTCAQLGASCGFVSDGCSQAVNCGNCTAPAVCGGSGKPNQCGCSAKTCAQLGTSCGTISDGCGQNVDCGGCGQGETCGGAGIAGRCGCACTLQHAITACAGGVCSIASCESGWADCDNDLANGCEAHVPDDPANCGTCGNACSFPHAAGVCSQSTCQMGACDLAWKDCDQIASDGCEINTDSDPLNCGGCDDACSTAGGTPQCWGGACGIACASGRGDCNTNSGDGCEVDLMSDLSNCGACGENCAGPLPPGVAAAQCGSGSCHVTSCNQGAYNEDGAFGNGCECVVDSHASDCALAETIFPNPIAIGGSAQVTGNLMPEGSVDWYYAVFSGNTSCSFHPRVELVDHSATGSIRIAVQTGCGSAFIGCSEGGNSASVTTWEFTYQGYCGTNSNPDPGKSPSSPTAVYIKVFATGGGTTCLPYALNIKN